MHWHLQGDDEHGPNFRVFFQTRIEARAAMIGIDNALRMVGFTDLRSEGPDVSITYKRDGEAGLVGGVIISVERADGASTCGLCAVA